MDDEVEEARRVFEECYPPERAAEMLAAFRRERQAVDAPPSRRGLLPGEPPPSVYIPILTGQEPDEEGKVYCCNEAHDDRNKPNLHLYSDGVYCFKCGFRTRMFGVAAMVCGKGRQEGKTWRTDSSERAPVYELLHNLGLRPKSEGRGAP